MKNTSRTRPTSSQNGLEHEHAHRDLKENVPEKVLEDRDSVTSDSEDKDAEEAMDSEGQGDGATESVLAGIVDAEGNVVDGEGNIVGKATRDVPEGSMVDTEGDALDTEGNIVGSAQPIDDAVKEGRDNANESVAGVEKSTEPPTSETPKGEEAEPDAGDGPVEFEDDAGKAAQVRCL